MPQLERDPRREFEEAHIPGAAFFDVDAIADRTTPLPHMLPGAAQFGRQVGELGISNDDLVVVYDVRGVVSAARVWWTFRAMGHDRVAVLDGGLRKWKAEGRMVETGPAKVAPARFRAHLRRGIVRNLEQVRRNIGTRREQVLDARSRGRFAGTEPEPRAGLRGGHIPGSLNLPYDALYQPDGTLLSPDGPIGYARWPDSACRSRRALRPRRSPFCAGGSATTSTWSISRSPGSRTPCSTRTSAAPC